MTQLETTLTILVWIYSTWCGYKLGAAAFRWWKRWKARRAGDPMKKALITATRRRMVWIELQGGGGLDGRQIYIDDPGPMLWIPTPAVPVSARQWPSDPSVTQPLHYKVFEFAGKIRRKILEPEEARVFRDDIQPMVGLSEKMASDLLALEHEILIYRHVPKL